MMNSSQILAQEFRLPNGSVIPNRLVKSAMSEALATRDGRPDERLVRLYGRIADGGIGLSITGNVMIDHRALGEPGNVVLEDESDMLKLKISSLALASQRTSQKNLDLVVCKSTVLTVI